MARIYALENVFENNARKRHESSHGLFRALSATDVPDSYNALSTIILDQNKKPIDINQIEPTTGFTPLLLAVSLCERIFHVYGPNRLTFPPHINMLLHMRLKNLELIASTPGVDPKMETPKGMNAEKLAASPETRTALYRGLNKPRKYKSNFLGKLTPDFRFTLE